MTDEKENTQAGHRSRTQKEPKAVHQSDGGKRLRAAYARVAATKAGQEVFRDLMQECGFKMPMIVRMVQMSGDGKSASLGDILPNGTIYNAARCDVWHNTRNKIPPKMLNIIEMESEPDVIDEPEETP